MASFSARLQQRSNGWIFGKKGLKRLFHRVKPGKPVGKASARALASINFGAIAIRSASIAPLVPALLGAACLRKDYVLQGASSRNLYRPSPRQGNDAFEAWLVVGKRQFAAMQARDR